MRAKKENNLRFKWLNYLADLVKSKKKGACPFCGADAVHYAITILCEERGDGFMEIWCDACNRRCLLYTSHPYVCEV